MKHRIDGYLSNKVQRVLPNTLVVCAFDTDRDAVGREEREGRETGNHCAPPWRCLRCGREGGTATEVNPRRFVGNCVAEALRCDGGGGGERGPARDVGQGETGKASPPLATVPNERDKAARANPRAGSCSTAPHHEGLHPALEAAPSSPLPLRKP